VLVVSEVRLFREGLARALRVQAETQLVEAATAREASSLLSTWRPDVVLADAATVRNTDLVARAVGIGARVVAFAVAEEDEAEVLACAEAGVAGFVGRDATLDELTTAVRAAFEGDVRCSPRVAALMIRRVAALAGAGVAKPGLNLTRREREITDLIDIGLSNKEIGLRLGIETATVKNHVHNLLEKLRVHRRGEAAALVRTNRLGTKSPNVHRAIEI
jgi:DNA-binding NarL/FixJ family response regulator